MQTGNFIINAFTAAFQTVSEIISNIFRSDGPTFMLIKSAFDFVAGYVKEKVAGSLADTFSSMGPAFANIAKGLKQNAEAGALSAEAALYRIPVAAELAAEDIGTNLAGSVGKFKQNLAEANTEFFNTSEQAKKVSELEDGIAAKIKEGTQNRAEANEEIKLTGTFAEKMATLEAAYKDAVDSGNTSIADRILKMRDTISATEEGKKLAEKEAEKKEEARRKEEESKELKRESLALDLQIAEALAGGNEEQAKALQYQKDFNGYLKQAQDAGMGDAAESFATAMARAAGSAKDIKEELSESAKLFKSIEEARAKDAVDRGGRDAQRAQDAIDRGDFRGAERAAGRIAAREERQGRQAGEKQAAEAEAAKPLSQRMAEGAQSFRARFAKSDKPAADQPAAEAPKSLRDRMAEGTQSFRDRMAGKDAVDKPGQSGKTDTAAKGGDKASGKASLDTMVESIQKLLEKIEPRLPVAALV
jgi:hypothetical protein